jgi:hypothetical protein
LALKAALQQIVFWRWRRMALHVHVLNWFTPVAMWEIYCNWSQNRCGINQRSWVDTDPFTPKSRLPAVGAGYVCPKTPAVDVESLLRMDWEVIRVVPNLCCLHQPGWEKSEDLLIMNRLPDGTGI